MSMQVKGTEKLVEALSQMSQARFDAVCQVSASNIYNRGKADGGTPVDTGELRQSLTIGTIDHGAEVGYIKDYAPHVEYGHRTRGSGYVEGQRYLERNVEKERPEFKQLLIDNIERLVK